MASVAQASPRDRMLLAMTQAVAEKGYAGTTVADVVRIAGVSRRTYYEQFEDKEHCFLEAYRAGAGRVIEEIFDALRELPDQDWRVRVGLAVETFTRVLAGEPALARVFFVDVLGAGPHAVDERRRVFDLFANGWRLLADRAERQDPALRHASDLALHGLVGALAEITLRQILESGAESLPSIAPALTDLSIRVIENA